ncbi:MAG: hypothetical protein ACTSYC_03000 [Promethearchaeota archaeon]
MSLEVRYPHVVKDIPHGEFITDLTAILYAFMVKLYRMRRGSTSKKNKKEIGKKINLTRILII